MKTVENLASTAAELSVVDVLENQIGLHNRATCMERKIYASRIPKLLCAGHLVGSLWASDSAGNVDTFRTYWTRDYVLPGLELVPSVIRVQKEVDWVLWFNGNENKRYCMGIFTCEWRFKKTSFNVMERQFFDFFLVSTETAFSSETRYWHHRT